jgi:hypothetical protein
MRKSDEKESIVARFDYDILTIEQQAVIRQKTDEIRERLQRSAQDIWEVGQRLADVRSHLKYGQFEAWLKAEFGWSRRTAYNFINVYETFCDRANLSQVNIATSALYLLASPSIPSEVRQQYLEQAQSGQRLNHKDLVKQIRQNKAKPLPNADTAILSQVQDASSPKAPDGSESTGLHQLDNRYTDASLWSDKPEIVRVIPRLTETLEPTLTLDVKSVAIPTNRATAGLAQPEFQLQPSQWYALGGQHYLFWGDTASPEFTQAIPTPTLAIAVTFHDWDHDWLVDTAKNLTVLNPETVSAKTLEDLINLLSQPGDVIVFPWLPQVEMIAIVDRLGRKAFAGDSSKERCQLAIKSCGLSLEPANLRE